MKWPGEELKAFLELRTISIEPEAMMNYNKLLFFAWTIKQRPQQVLGFLKQKA